MAASKRNSQFLWFGLGAVLGVIAARRLFRPQPDASHRIAQLKAWQGALIPHWGRQKAAFLAAQAQARYERLFAGRPRFRNPALRAHLESHILPGIALYQALQEWTGDQATALADLDACFAAHVRTAQLQRRQMEVLIGLPGGFTIFRLANHAVLRRSYPKDGWQIEWVEDSPQRVAYDITGCFYLNVLDHYGVPELTAHFCALDDLLYGNLRNLTWERTETLGRGDPRCNFAFRPRQAAPAQVSIFNTPVEAGDGKDAFASTAE